MDALIRKFMPYVYFHPDERHFPVTVDEYLAQCALINPTTRQPVPLGPLTNTVMDQLPPDQCTHNLALIGGTSNPLVHNHAFDARVPILVHVVRTAACMYIQYILFYAYNGSTSILNGALYLGAHEADIENVTATVVNGECTGWHLSHHGEESLAQSGHVYVARGSHANYASPGAHRRIYGCAYDMTSDRGVCWHPENYLVLHDPDTPGYNPETMGFLRLRGCMGDGLTGGAVDNLPLKPWWTSGYIDRYVDPADLSDEQLYNAGKSYATAAGVR